MLLSRWWKSLNLSSLSPISARAGRSTRSRTPHRLDALQRVQVLEDRALLAGTVTLEIDPAAVAEVGEASASAIAFLFTRTDVAGDLLVNFTVGGSASYDESSSKFDYSVPESEPIIGNTGTILIADGLESGRLFVTPIDDTEVESDETVQLTLTAGDYTIGTASEATGTIIDDDAIPVVPTVSVDVANLTLAETDKTATVFTFERSEVGTEDLTISFAINGSATAGKDYTTDLDPIPATVTIPAGELSANLTLTVVGDTIDERDEDVRITLTEDATYELDTDHKMAAVTIADNDLSTVSISLNPASVLENGGKKLEYRVSRTNFEGAVSAISVGFSVSNASTAKWNSDYTVQSTSFNGTNGAITIGSGKDSAVISVIPIGDTQVEQDETVIIALTSSSKYTLGAVASQQGSILDDDTSAISLRADRTSTSEDGTAINYTFSRTNNSTSAPATRVDFEISGDATNGADYVIVGGATVTGKTGSVVIPAGTQSVTVTVQPANDLLDEPDETVALRLLNSQQTPPAYVPASTNAVPVTIVDNDASTITVAVTPASVREDQTGKLRFEFTRDSWTANSPAVTVNFNVRGTATFATDYTVSGTTSIASTSGSVQFAAGAKTALVLVDPTSDSTFEPDETVSLQVSAGTGYRVSPNASLALATGKIVNDDLPTVSVVAETAQVFEDGNPNLAFTFTRTGVSSQSPALTVNLEITGAAVFQTDYSAIGATLNRTGTGTLVFAAGEMTKTVILNPRADNEFEGDEEVVLTVVAGSNYQPQDEGDSATGTILDDDMPTLSVTTGRSPVSETRYEAHFVFTRSNVGPTTAAQTVAFTVNGTATYLDDYNVSGAASFDGTQGTVTFPIGASSVTVIVDPIDDSLDELDETVTLTVSNGARPASSATATILDTDASQITLSVAPASVSEDGGGSLQYTFSRGVAAPTALVVAFIVRGTATFGEDYSQTGATTFSARNGTVSIPAGQAAATINIQPVADSNIESDELVRLQLSSGSGYDLVTRTYVTGTIQNDDAMPAIQFDDPVGVAESAGVMVFTVSLSRAINQVVTVSYVTSSGSATAYADFRHASGVLTFNPGETVKTFAVTIIDDTSEEADETFRVGLSNAVNATFADQEAIGRILNDDTPLQPAP